MADTPTANLIRQVLGAVSEFEKAMLVEKLRGARERKRRETGRKVGGRKSYAGIEGGPELIAMAKKLHRYPVNGRRRTLADIAKALAGAGYRSSAGTPYTPTAVSRILASRGSERTAPRSGRATSSSLPLEVDPPDAAIQVTEVVNRDAHWKSNPLQPVAAELLDEAAEGAEPGLQTPLGSRWSLWPRGHLR